MTKRQGVVPVLRDYIARNEAHLRGAEKVTRQKLRLAAEQCSFIKEPFEYHVMRTRDSAAGANPHHSRPYHEILRARIFVS
jgi:hypothetical protein